jgi:hypothetical protein
MHHEIGDKRTHAHTPTLGAFPILGIDILTMRVADGHACRVEQVGEHVAPRSLAFFSIRAHESTRALNKWVTLQNLFCEFLICKTRQVQVFCKTLKDQRPEGEFVREIRERALCERFCHWS